MYYIGVDLGGTNCVVGLVDENGTIMQYDSKPTRKERTVEAIFDDIIEGCRKLIKEHKLDHTNLKGIGIGTPGMINTAKGVIDYANNIKIKDFDAVGYIKKHLDFPVSIANDADCAALGEVVAGGAKGFENVVVFTLGTGVGGGVVIDGKLFTGSFAGATEIGHQIIVKNGKECSCGNKGCLESYASATGLINLAREKALENKDSMLYKLVNGNMEKMNAKIPFDAAQAGDEIGQCVIDEYMDYLAIGIANAINVFRPEVVLIGGGVSRQEENLTKPLGEKVKELVYARVMHTQIRTARLGNDAGLIGAAMLNKA